MFTKSRVNNPKPCKLPLQLGNTRIWGRPSCELVRFLTRGRFAMVYTGRWHMQNVVVKQIPIDNRNALLFNLYSALVWPFVKVVAVFPNICIKRTENHMYRSKLEFIENEIKILSRCQSRYVVQLLDVYIFASHAWLVTNACLGSVGSLFVSKDQYLTRYNIHPDLACYLMFPIFQAVAHINELHIMHRDINLGNILLRSDFVPVLSDFGTATEFDVEPVSDGYDLGNNENRPPEIWSGKPYSRTIDTWGVATCILQLIHISYYFGIADPNPLPGIIDFYIRGYESQCKQEALGGKEIADLNLHRSLNIQDLEEAELVQNRQEAKKDPERHRWIRALLRKILVFSFLERPSCKTVTELVEFKDFASSNRCSREHILKLTKKHMHESMAATYYETLDDPTGFILPDPTIS